MLKLTASHNNDIFNVGSSVAYSICEFAAKICEIVKLDEQKILYDTSKYVGAKSKVLNVDKLKSQLPSFCQKTWPGA